MAHKRRSNKNEVKGVYEVFFHLPVAFKAENERFYPDIETSKSMWEMVKDGVKICKIIL